MKLFDGHRFCPPTDDIQLHRFLTHHFERIGQSFHNMRVKQFSVRDLNYSLFDGKQMPGQIAAINGRNVAR